MAIPTKYAAMAEGGFRGDDGDDVDLRPTSGSLNDDGGHPEDESDESDDAQTDDEDGSDDHVSDSEFDAQIDDEGSPRRRDRSRDDEPRDELREQSHKRNAREPSVEDLLRDNGRKTARIAELERQLSGSDVTRQSETIAALMRQVEELKSMVGRSAAPPQKEEPSAPVITDEVADLLGGRESVEAVRQVVATEAERLMRERLRPIEDRFSSLSEQQARVHEQVFLDGIRRQFPGVDRLVNDPDWKEFANLTPAGIVDKTFGQIIMENHAARNASGVLAVLNAYKAHQLGRNADNNNSGRRFAPTAESSPRNSLDRLATPTKSDASAPVRRAREVTDDDAARWKNDLLRGAVDPYTFRQRMARLNAT